MAGRTSKISEDRIKRICNSIKMWSGKMAAASSNGVSYQTAFVNWYEKADEALEKLERNETLDADELLYVKFKEDAEEALGIAEASAAATMARAAMGHKRKSKTTKTVIAYETTTIKQKDGSTKTTKKPHTLSLSTEYETDEPDWHAAESMLKRQFKDRWGDAQNIAHSGKIDSDVKVNSEEMEQAAKEIAEWRKEQTQNLEGVLNTLSAPPT